METCQICCSKVAQNLGNLEFDLLSCQIQGCDRQFGDDERCQELLPNTDINDNRRLACEIGRDFRITGISALVDSNQRTLCNSLGNLEEIVLEFPQESERAVSQDDCEDCCVNVNQAKDQGNDDAPDDFRRSRCDVSLLISTLLLSRVV